LVTVIANDATTADGLSKVVSILGHHKSFPIVKRFGAAARVVRMPNEAVEEHETKDFRAYEDPNRDAGGK
jgi:thiamine biosynthesis lipoprotein ApbE